MSYTDSWLRLLAELKLPPEVATPTLTVYDPLADITQQLLPLPPTLASSLLVLTPTPYDFISTGATDYGRPPDFVVTSAGDVIGVPGR